MMRKTTLILLGAAVGAAMTLLATQPRMIFVGATAKAAVADTYRQLNLFGDIFERVRADHVDKPDNGKLVESAHTTHFREVRRVGSILFGRDHGDDVPGRIHSRG